MTNLLQHVLGRAPERTMLGHDPDAEWSVGDNVYFGRGGAVNGEETPAPGEYLTIAQRAYKSNGPVFALMAVRQMVFTEAVFKYQKLRNSRPGDLYGDASLGILERPWPNGTTSDLLGKMINHADMAGNSFVARRQDDRNKLRCLRPDWTTIILGSNEDPEMFGDALDAEVIGYAYMPHGRTIEDADIILPKDMAHFAPHPDPEFTFRGMSWVQPCLPEVVGDRAATTHKIKFFENGATATTYIALDPNLDPDKVARFRTMFEEQHRGVANAYRTIILGGGADARAIGADLRQLDFKATQGAGETRLAAAAGVPASIVGFSEGMQGSALNAGNYTSARRRFSDATMRPLWRMAAAALSNLMDLEPGTRLWYDDRDVPFLRDDRQVVAEIMARHASTVQTLINAGFEPDSVVDSLVNENYRLLSHTGLYSVQLQPPTTPEQLAQLEATKAGAKALIPGSSEKTPTEPTAPANGKVKIKIGAKA